MKVIGVCGSPRRGNSEWMLDKVMTEAAARGAEVETLLLRKLDVRMCRGCLTCESGGPDRPGVCEIKDDLNALYPRLVAAEAFVLATPVYFEMLSGRLKNFLDRTCPIWPRLQGKRVAGLAVAEEGIGQAVRNLRRYADVCQMQWVGSVTALAGDPGEAARVPGLEARLKRLARKLTT